MRHLIILGRCRGVIGLAALLAGAMWVVVLGGCGEEGSMSKSQIDAVLEEQIAESGVEASHWLTTNAADSYIKAVTDGFYARGSKAVWLAGFIEVEGVRLPMRLIVEIPIDKTGREAVVERFGQVVNETRIQQADQLVGNRYLMLPLDE